MKDPEFTGERFIPGKGGAQLAYEHLHRYLFAARWARGKSVLDIATGNGYGAALLAAAARKVWALDLDEATVGRARGSHRQSNLCFLRGDAASLPFPSRSVGLVVAMEVLEHIGKPDDLVAEAARVLEPGGVFLVSTPNKSSYSDARHYENPFHVREYYRDEFEHLLSAHFPCVKLMPQQVRAGSLIVSEETSAEFEILTTPAPDPTRPVVEPMYFVAICGRDRSMAIRPAGSAYLDVTDALFGEWGLERDATLAEIEKLNREIEALGLWNRDLDRKIDEVMQTVGERDETIRALQREMMEEIGRRDEALVKLQEEFDERTRWALDLERDVAARDERLKHANEELCRVSDHLAHIRHAFLYRVLCRLGLLPK